MPSLTNPIQTGDRAITLTADTEQAQAPIRINNPLTLTRVIRVQTTRTVIRVVRESAWRWIWWRRFHRRRRDPLAQTFSFPQNRIVTGIGVFFTNIDPSIPVTVQVRGVTTGLPNDAVLAETMLAPQDITLDQETRITFPDPFYAEANTSYAIVLLTNSTHYRVRIATLGKAGPNGLITAQAYNQGVLLESSNAETWTPLNGSDLTMRIYGQRFHGIGEIRFQKLTNRQAAVLNLDEFSAIPQDTGITWEYSNDDGTTWHAFVPGQEEQLANLTNDITIRAILTNQADTETPAINFRDVNLITHQNRSQGTYLTRESQLAQSVQAARLYSQMNIPSGTSVNWFASNDNGTTWAPATIQDTRIIDNTWTEYTMQATFADPTQNRVRFKAEMTGSPLIHPRIHTLGATLS